MKCVCLFVAQSCLTLSDAMGCSPPGSSVHGISQARILEWVALSFFRVSSRPRDQTQISYIAGRFYHLSLEGNFMKQAGQTLFPFYREGNCGIKMLHNMHTKRPTKQPFPGYTDVGHMIPHASSKLPKSQNCLLTQSQNELGALVYS